MYPGCLPSDRQLIMLLLRAGCVLCTSRLMELAIIVIYQLQKHSAVTIPYFTKNISFVMARAFITKVYITVEITLCNGCCGHQTNQSCIGWFLLLNSKISAGLLIGEETFRTADGTQMCNHMSCGVLRVEAVEVIWLS